MRRPDFFIVGAPKAGTTAMHAYLSQHPDVFMAAKELHYFGTDLTFRFTPRLTEEEYLGFFAKAARERRVGESSVRYLQSRQAAAEIHAFAPAAQVIAMLRNPIDMMYAMHSELLFSGMEDIEDFAEALAAEADRGEGDRIPAGTNIPQMLLYRQSARYSEQLRRFFDILGRENVRVVIYDDFVADTAREYRETLEFLGVDAAFSPRFEARNVSKTPRSRLVRSFLATPPAAVRRAARATLSRGTRKRIYQLAQRLNARPARRPPMALELRAQLAGEFREEVRALGVLLGRDLANWVEQAAPVPPGAPNAPPGSTP